MDMEVDIPSPPSAAHALQVCGELRPVRGHMVGALGTGISLDVTISSPIRLVTGLPHVPRLSFFIVISLKNA